MCIVERDICIVRHTTRKRGCDLDMAEGFSSVQQRQRAIIISLSTHRTPYADSDLFSCLARAIGPEQISFFAGRGWFVWCLKQLNKPRLPQHGVRGLRTVTIATSGHGDVPPCSESSIVDISQANFTISICSIVIRRRTRLYYAIKSRDIAKNAAVLKPIDPQTFSSCKTFIIITTCCLS